MTSTPTDKADEMKTEAQKLAFCLRRIDEIVAERDEALRIAKSLTKTLTGLTANGSEFFHHNAILDDYFADEAACSTYLFDTRNRTHEAILNAVNARKASEARLAEVEGALRAIAEGYKAEGKDDRFVVVENPAATAEAVAMHGVDPFLVIDTFALLPSETREGGDKP